jgi:hypothetical protein
MHKWYSFITDIDATPGYILCFIERSTMLEFGMHPGAGLNRFDPL